MRWRSAGSARRGCGPRRGGRAPPVLRAGAVDRQRRLPAVLLIGGDGVVELPQLLLCGAAELLDLLDRVGVVRRRRLELTQLGFNAQASPFVRLEVACVAAQQVGPFPE